MEKVRQAAQCAGGHDDTGLGTMDAQEFREGCQVVVNLSNRLFS